MAAQQDEGTYEDIYNIPTAGRNPYERWLAAQWRAPAAAYSMSQYLDPGRGATESEGAGQQQTFASYLRGRRGEGGATRQPISSIDSSYLSRLLRKTPTEQRAMLEVLPEYVGQQAFRGGLESQYSPFVAGRMMQQAYDPAVRRAFDVREESARPGAEQQVSFLDYLRNRYLSRGQAGVRFPRRS
jgi:hypothetical protein